MVRSRFGESFENGLDLFINGTLKKFDDIERIKVFKTNNRTDRSGFIEVKDGDIYWHAKPEVTNQFITHTPGNKKKIPDEKTIIENSVQPRVKALNELTNILSKFPMVARQLNERHGRRGAFVIEDEYDVKDLLHALLKLHFDDISPEEVTPSCAGSSSRTDFLLKNEQIAVEVKKTRRNLGDKEVGDQLMVDIAKYSTHSDIKTLVCFVYDPDRIIKNPTGLENDLNIKSTDSLLIVARIEPKN